jgi:hypothetical protein
MGDAHCRVPILLGTRHCPSLHCPLHEKENRQKRNGPGEGDRAHEGDPTRGAEKPLEKDDRASRFGQVQATPEREQGGHDGERCDDDKIAPNEWKDGLPPGCETAKSVRPRRIGQRHWYAGGRFPEENKAESANEPVAQPQRVRAGARSPRRLDNRQGRRNPEELGDEDERDDDDSTAAMPCYPCEGVTKKSVNREHPHEIYGDSYQTTNEFLGHHGG